MNDSRHRLARICCGLLALAPLAYAQNPQLVRDINTTFANKIPSFPADFATAGAWTFFTAETQAQGRELYRTDGTEAGTQLIVDIVPGAGGSNARNVTSVGNRVYFVATTSSQGSELWTSDGTAGGTRIVVDRNPGPGGTAIGAAPVALGGRLFFTIAGQRALFSTDVAGTSISQVGPSFTNTPLALTSDGTSLYFFASGMLWLSDGTTAGTQSLAINTGPFGNTTPVILDDGTFVFGGAVNGSTGLFFASAAGVTRICSGTTLNTVAVGNTVFFTRSGGGAGTELWKADATNGCAMVKDIVPGSGSPTFGDFVAAGPLLFFSADDGITGLELWRSDGTETGTFRLTDVRPGNFDSGITEMAAFGNRLVFQADDGPGIGTTRQEPYISDGTLAGTMQIVDLAAGFSNSRPKNFHQRGGVMLFSAHNGFTSDELFSTDGTAVGTLLVKDINVDPRTADGDPEEFIDAYGTLLFAASDGFSGSELWKSDGTLSGTVLVKDIGSGRFSSFPDDFVNFLGATYFAASGPEGNELWKTDGTGAGTVLVADINPGSGSGRVDQLVADHDTLFFVANDGASGDELFVSDGSTAGTLQLKDIEPGVGNGDPENLTMVNERLFFTATQSTTGTELWTSDGTSAGTFLVKDINPGATSSRPGELVAFDGVLFFVADDGVNGEELWKSDGTSAGTVMVADINPGAGRSSVEDFAQLGDWLYFSADDGATGDELWRTDGVTTERVVDIWPGVDGSDPDFLTVAGDTIFFVAEQAATGEELWKSDGTAAGTMLVKDIDVGGSDSDIEFLTPIGSRGVVFSAEDNAGGQEPWISDGTLAGTVRLLDVWPGSSSSDPEEFGTACGLVYFSAESPDRGVELYVYDPGASALPFGRSCAVPTRHPTMTASDPVLGGTMTVSGREAFAGASGVALIGQPAPSAFLWQGCEIYIDVTAPSFVLGSVTNTGRTWSFSVPIPDDPALLNGSKAMLQMAFINTDAPRLLEWTNGVAIRIGM